jgi:hypothetical protein
MARRKKLCDLCVYGTRGMHSTVGVNASKEEKGMPILQVQKERLTIASLGRVRFWNGVVAGVLTAVALSLLMNHWREMMRYLNTLEADLLMPDPHSYWWHSLFVTTLSVALGLSLTIWIWMGNNRHKKQRDRLRKRAAQTYALLTFWVVLMVVTRFGTLAQIIQGNITGTLMPLYSDICYFLIIILLPLVVFLQNWMGVRRVYRAGRWMGYSLVVSILLVMILMQAATVHPQRINRFYQTAFADEYNYIDREIHGAEKLYGISFTTETIEALKQWHSTASQQQVDRIRKAFSTDGLVPLDTIILQKLVIRNLKSGMGSHAHMYCIPFCYYASPDLIVDQIERHGQGSPERRELLAILGLYQEILKTPPYDWERRNEYTPLGARMALAAHSTSGQILEFHLKNALEALQEGVGYEMKNEE